MQKSILEKFGYKLVWSDEFNSTELDMSKWSYRYLGPRKDGVNAKDAVFLDGKGCLVLTTKQVGNEFHTAMIGTQGKFETRFGYFECRVKFQKSIGHSSAFWLQSPTVNEIGDPQKAGAEIDIFEYIVRMPDTLFICIHWDGYGENHKSISTKCKKSGLGEGFHIIGLEWTPNEYVFYLDGEEVWRTNQAVSHVNQYIILSLGVGGWGGDIRQAKLPDSCYVDYVRVYKRPF